VKRTYVRESQRISSRFGSIDILLNNAGVPSVISHRTRRSGWDRCMAVNLKGGFLCSKHVIPHMLNRGGSIINMSSVTGIVGVRNRSAYSASRAPLPH